MIISEMNGVSQLLSNLSHHVMSTRFLHVVIYSGILSVCIQHRGGLGSHHKVGLQY